MRNRLLSSSLLALAGLAGATAVATAQNGSLDVTAALREQSTQLISRAADGGLPNGPSTHAVISRDQRYASIIAFESEASNLVAGDTNNDNDVFVVPRAGSYGNNGSAWRGGRTALVSRALGGQSANGPSYEPSVSGSWSKRGSCIAFLSAASNLVRGDTNDQVDAFLVRRPGARPQRVSLLPGNKQSSDATNSVAVSGDCSRVSFAAGGKLYTRQGRTTRRVPTAAPAIDPSYASGTANSMVYATRYGVYLSPDGFKRGNLVAPGGARPSLNDMLGVRTIAYDKVAGGHTQVFYGVVGKGMKVISKRGGALGNGESYGAAMGSVGGYYAAFTSTASNLQTNAGGGANDHNDKPDVYMYTARRDITLVQSVERKAVPLPGGGTNASMSFFANYITFDSPAPLGRADGPHQIFMRYLGPK
jgi:hypothetical protein